MTTTPTITMITDHNDHLLLARTQDQQDEQNVLFTANPLSNNEFKEASWVFRYFEENALSGAAKQAVFRAIDAYIGLGCRGHPGMNERQFLCYGLGIPGSSSQRNAFDRAAISQNPLLHRRLESGQTMAQLEKLYYDRLQEMQSDSDTVATTASIDSVYDWEGLDDTMSMSEFIKHKRKEPKRRTNRRVRCQAYHRRIVKAAKSFVSGEWKRRRAAKKRANVVSYEDYIERQRRGWEQSGRADIYRLHNERHRFERKLTTSAIPLNRNEYEAWVRAWEERHDQAQDLFHAVDEELQWRLFEAGEVVRVIDGLPAFPF